MNKKKKLIIILTSISFFVVGILIFVICLSNMSLFTNKHLGEDTYSKYIKILNKYNTSLVIYGDEVEFRDGLKYKNIVEIDKSSFEKKGDEFLIINDRLSNASLVDEDYTKIKELVSNGITFIYIGGSKLNIFKEKGFLDEDYPNDVLEFSMSAFSSKATCYGPWSYESEEAFKINDELLGESVVFDVVDELARKYNIFSSEM